MSYDSPNFNPLGVLLKAAAASFTVNAFIHPISTAKNIKMANRIPLEPLYKNPRNIFVYYSGYLSLSLSETTQLVAYYYLNEKLKKMGYNEHACAFIPSIAVSPLTALGEGVMVTKQTNQSRKISLFQASVNSIRPSCLFATLARDMPYVYAIFAGAPILQRQLKNPEQTSMQALAGLVSGFMAGILTGPLDHIKTIIQADNVTYRKGVNTFMQHLKNPRGRKIAYISAGYHGLYVSCAIGILNILNNQFPKTLLYSE